MALVPLRLLLDHAAENGYGIPAFNVNNLEQVQAIMEAAYETDSPVILQASRGKKLCRRNFPTSSNPCCHRDISKYSSGNAPRSW